MNKPTGAKKTFQRIISFNIFVIFCTVLIALAQILYLRYMLLVAEVEGPSMMPTINADYNAETNYKDYVYLESTGVYNRGDIIVADDPDGVKVIKRLIALGGDTLQIKQVDNNYKIFVNGEMLEETYLGGQSNEMLYVNWLKLFNPLNSRFSFDPSWYNYDINSKIVTLPENYVFYLGDNRSNSEDCSIYGPVLKEKLLARAVLLVPYNSSEALEFVKTLLGLDSIFYNKK